MSYLIYFQPSSESSRPQYPGAGQSTLGLLGLREQSAIRIARLMPPPPNSAPLCLHMNLPEVPNLGIYLPRIGIIISVVCNCFSQDRLTVAVF